MKRSRPQSRYVLSGRLPLGRSSRAQLEDAVSIPGVRIVRRMSSGFVIQADPIFETIVREQFPKLTLQRDSFLEVA